MTLDKGSLILVDYTAKIKDTNEIFETTSEEEAKKLESFDSSIKYEPRLVSIGEGWVIKGLDEALSTTSPGEEFNLEIPPEKAFGSREQGKVRMIPLRKLGDKADELKPGDIVDIDDRKGMVRFIGSGRVQIDFNHRLAGKTLRYDVKVLKILGSEEEKIISLIKRRIPVERERIKLIVDKATADIELPQDISFLEGFQIIKKAISDEIFRFVPSIDNIKFIEEYHKQKSETTEQKSERSK